MLRAILIGMGLALAGGSVGGAGEGTPAEAPPPRPAVSGTIDLGYQDLSVDGSFPRFGQYLIPPEGLFLQRLLVASQDERGQTLFQTQLYDLGEDYYRGAASITPGDLQYSLHYRFDRARFFPEPTFLPGPPQGQRLESTTRLHVHSSGSQFAELRFQHLRVAEPGLRLGRIAYRADNVDLRGIWPAGPGQLDLRYSELEFSDGTSRQPLSRARTYAAEYALDLNSTATLAAAYARTDINQAQLPGSRVRVWRLAGAYAPGPHWDAQARYELRSVDLGGTQNAYTRENSLGTLKATYRPQPDLALRLAYEQRDLERFNADRTRLDAPQWRLLRFTANWKGPRRLGVDGHYEWRDLGDNPGRPGSRPGDLRPLSPDRERRFEIKANLPLAPRGFAYGLFRDRRRENEARNLSYTLRSLGLGGFYQASPQLSVEATLGRDEWSSNAAVLQEALADAQVVTLSGNYTVSAQGWVRASYSRYQGDEVSEVDEDQGSFSGGYTLSDGATVTLTYQNGDYENTRFPGLAYEVDRWKIAYSKEF